MTKIYYTVDFNPKRRRVDLEFISSIQEYPKDWSTSETLAIPSKEDPYITEHRLSHWVEWLT
jgi:hypothetical protein